VFVEERKMATISPRELVAWVHTDKAESDCIRWHFSHKRKCSAASVRKAVDQIPVESALREGRVQDHDGTLTFLIVKKSLVDRLMGKALP
jgi:hypothetical protein